MVEVTSSNLVVPTNYLAITVGYLRNLMSWIN